MTEQPLREGEGPRTAMEQFEDALFQLPISEGQIVQMQDRAAAIEDEARATAGAVEPRFDNEAESDALSKSGAAGAVEGADPLRAALIEIRDTAYDTNDECRYCDSDIEEDHPEDCPASIALSALVRATTPEAPASPPPLDVELLALALDSTGVLLNRNALERIIAEYAALASAAPSEPGEPEA